MDWWKSTTTARHKHMLLLRPARLSTFKWTRRTLDAIRRTRAYGYKRHQFTWPERYLLTQALLLLPLTALALRCFRLRRLYPRQATWQANACVTANPGATLCRAYTTARMVQIAARHSPVHSNCLEQSLTLCWLLRGQGITSELYLGARMEAGQFEAHAWVEHAGCVLNDRNDVRRRFATFGQAIGSARVTSP